MPPLSTHKWKLSFLLIDVWLFPTLNCTRWIKTEQRRRLAAHKQWKTLFEFFKSFLMQGICIYGPCCFFNVGVYTSFKLIVSLVNRNQRRVWMRNRRWPKPHLYCQKHVRRVCVCVGIYFKFLRQVQLFSLEHRCRFKLWPTRLKTQFIRVDTDCAQTTWRVKILEFFWKNQWREMCRCWGTERQIVWWKTCDVAKKV